jgi:hypothetical protein
LLLARRWSNHRSAAICWTILCGDYFDRVEAPKMIPSDEWLLTWMPLEYDRRVASRRALGPKSR